MSKPGLLDKPWLLEAMLTGKHTVETRAGRLVGTYATHAEAFNASMDAVASSLTITPPAEDTAHLKQCILDGVAKREAKGRPVPPETLKLKVRIVAGEL